MTSTVEPQPAHRVSERQGSAGPSAGTGEHLVHGRLGRLGNQLGTQVLLQRLVCRAITRWKPALNAFAITLADRLPKPETRDR